MICLLHANQPGINADTSFGEFAIENPKAQFLSIGAELAGEVSLWLLLEFTLPEKEEVFLNQDKAMGVQDATAEMAAGLPAN